MTKAQDLIYQLSESLDDIDVLSDAPEGTAFKVSFMLGGGSRKIPGGIKKLDRNNILVSVNRVHKEKFHISDIKEFRKSLISRDYYTVVPETDLAKYVGLIRG
jgi:hypothetical protein